MGDLIILVGPLALMIFAVWLGVFLSNQTR